MLMTDNLVLDCFDSLWHYGGLPPLSATPPPVTCSPNPTDRSCCSTLCPIVVDAGMILSQAGSLEPLFAVLDEDGDGRLTLCEMSSLLAKLGMSNTRSDNLLSLIHSSVPNLYAQQSSIHDHVPSLDFPQFAHLCASLFTSPPQTPPAHDVGFDDELLDAFQVYDKNRDGFISAAELAAVLCELGLLPAGNHHRGLDAHLGACQAYIETVDLDGNGMVDLQEFRTMMMHNRPPTSRHTCSSMSRCASIKLGLPLACKT